jgi:predicted metal-dependent hydrolase
MREGFASHLSPCYSIQFFLQRSKRKTVSIRITDEAIVCVFAPFLVSLSKIESFVDQKHDWIRKNQRKTKDKLLLPVLSAAEKKAHSKNVKKKAEAVLINYQGVKPKRVFVRYSRTRWGSCSTLGNISLNGYLDFLPDELFQYVVCHELTHLIHMNHSALFWADLARLIPDPRKMKVLLDYYKIPSL